MTDIKLRSEMIVFERLRGLDDWWYGLDEFAVTAGFSKNLTRILLFRLCRMGLVDRLVDDEGEGFFLHKES